MGRAAGAETLAMSTSPSITAGARVAGRTLVRVPAPLVLLAWVAVASLVQLVRAPGLPSWSVLWTEDGSVFLQQALVRSFPDTLGTTAVGYLHVVPRLLVEPATWFPLDAAAAIIAAGAAITASLLAAYVWVATRSVFDTWRSRALVVALFLFSPPAAIELSGAAQNFHWYGLAASFWAPAGQPHRGLPHRVQGAAALRMRCFSARNSSSSRVPASWRRPSRSSCSRRSSCAGAAPPLPGPAGTGSARRSFAPAPPAH